MQIPKEKRKPILIVVLVLIMIPLVIVTLNRGSGGPATAAQADPKATIGIKDSTVADIKRIQQDATIGGERLTTDSVAIGERLINDSATQAARLAAFRNSPDLPRMPDWDGKTSQVASAAPKAALPSPEVRSTAKVPKPQMSQDNSDYAPVAPRPRTTPRRERETETPKRTEQNFNGFQVIRFTRKNPVAPSSTGSPAVTAGNQPQQSSQSTAADESDLIATIQGAKVNDGGTITAIISNRFSRGNIYFNPGDRLTGIVSYYNDRATILFRTAIINKRIVNLNFTAFDAEDGLEGVPISGSALKKGADNGLKQAGATLLSNATSQLNSGTGAALKSLIGGVGQSQTNQSVSLTIPSRQIFLKYQ